MIRVGSEATAEWGDGGEPLAKSRDPRYSRDPDRLPGYVRKPAELTDGHLLELARAQRARLVTLDVSIPGAVLIG